MSYENPRINIDMSTIDVITAMAEGNPGALRVLVEVIKATPEVDPDSALGWLGPLCTMDNLDCYGSKVWLLYKDICGQDVRHMIAVLRASQLGFVSRDAIKAAMDGRDQLDVPALVAQVKARLPAFQAEAT